METASVVDFWSSLEQLLLNNPWVINRPQGSRHPRYPKILYPLDYGYLEGTQSADGSGIDIWVGSQSSHHLCGIICTFDTLKLDAEIKLLIGCSSANIRTILDFHNNGMKAIFVPNPSIGEKK